MKYNQPKICPLVGFKGFSNHEEKCSHGENYVKECAEFSRWFWYKVAQFQVEPITEEKIPTKLIQKIYGRGQNETDDWWKFRFNLFLDALGEITGSIGLNQEKFLDEVDELCKRKIEQTKPKKNIFTGKIYTP